MLSTDLRWGCYSSIGARIGGGEVKVLSCHWTAIVMVCTGDASLLLGAAKAPQEEGGSGGHGGRLCLGDGGYLQLVLQDLCLQQSLTKTKEKIIKNTSY